MKVTWYADEAAKHMHALLQQELAGIIARLCPGHELSHVGINRNSNTEEIVLKLHLNPIGRVRVVPEPSPSQARLE